MVEVVLAESAWDDLESIVDYIALDSPRYAQDFSDRILERIEQLKTYPESGKQYLNSITNCCANWFLAVIELFIEFTIQPKL